MTDGASELVSTGWPLLLASVYLGLLTLLSRWAGDSTLAARWAGKPLVFALSLGVYASTWTFYGSVGFATRYGYGFAAISLGVVLACLAIPLLWAPLSEVVREHRLASVADLLAYRFHSRAVGVCVTLFLLAGLLPYLALQLRAIGDAAMALAGSHASTSLGVSYMLLLILFTAAMGAHFADPWAKPTALVVVLAGETLFKLVALLVVAGHALFGVLGGPSGLLQTLARRPEILEQLYAPVHEGSFSALILLAFASSFLLPRQYHVAFVLQPSQAALSSASWTVPLLLLLLNLPLPILLLAGQVTTPAGTSPDLFVLLASPSPAVRTLAFLGGVSAASAMVLVSTIALSGMVVHHLWQPFIKGTKLVSRTPGVRRGVVLLVIAAAFGIHLLLPRHGSLVDLGLVSFSAVLQLLPAVLAALFWRRASRGGFLLGLTGGGLVWVASAWLPLLGRSSLEQDLSAALGLGAQPQLLGVWISLALNAGLLVLGSLLLPGDAQEAAAADSMHASRRARLSVPPGLLVPPDSVVALEQRMARVLGPDAARRQVDRSLAELRLHRDERSMLALSRLVTHTRKNLSEALGPLAAATAFNTAASGEAPPVLGAQLLLLEQRLAGGGGGTLGAAYGFVLGALSDLPVGLCAIDGEGRVAVWNQALVTISGVPREQALGGSVERLEPPFSDLLRDERTGSHEVSLHDAERARTLRIYRAPFAAGALVMVEDLTEAKALREHLAHHDRLTHLGQLAAGVAHEIGNPLAGLLMVAKNLRRELHDTDAPERLEAIVHEANRIEAIVRSLLTFSHPGSPAEARPVLSLAGVVTEAVKLVELSGRVRGGGIEASVDPDLRVRADHQSLVQVVVNLLSNALDASPPEAPVAVRMRRVGSRALLDVEDHGNGVPEAILGSLFTPFATTKNPGQGTGLGLAISLRIARDHGGTLAYERVAGSLTRFRLDLPSAWANQDVQDVASDASASSGENFA